MHFQIEYPGRNLSQGKQLVVNQAVNNFIVSTIVPAYNEAGNIDELCSLFLIPSIGSNWRRMMRQWLLSIWRCWTIDLSENKQPVRYYAGQVFFNSMDLQPGFLWIVLLAVIRSNSILKKTG